MPMTLASKVRLRTLDDLDGRTGAAKRALALVAQLENDLGADPTIAQRELVKRAGALSAILEDFEARWLKDERLSLADYLAACNVQRRILATLGLERRARDVTSLVNCSGTIPMPSLNGTGAGSPKTANPLSHTQWRKDPIAFIEQVLVDPETKRPFSLLPAERAFLEHAFRDW
jgi:hypothetical protein